jgi:hypothetical protein
MQFKVPQNLEMEDKIIGPLTLIQFVYLMTGGVLIYISMNVFSGFVFIFIALIVGSLALALAFLKVQDQPFLHFLSSLALYVVKPRTRVWGKNPDTEMVHAVIEKKEEKKEEKKIYKQKSLREVNLEELAYVLDTRGLGENNPKTTNAKPIENKPIKPVNLGNTQNANQPKENS